MPQFKFLWTAAKSDEVIAILEALNKAEFSGKMTSGFSRYTCTNVPISLDEQQAAP